jgi:hypothetical protein
MDGDHYPRYAESTHLEFITHIRKEEPAAFTRVPRNALSRLESTMTVLLRRRYSKPIYSRLVAQQIHRRRHIPLDFLAIGTIRLCLNVDHRNI